MLDADEAADLTLAAQVARIASCTGTWTGIATGTGSGTGTVAVASAAIPSPSSAKDKADSADADSEEWAHPVLFQLRRQQQPEQHRQHQQPQQHQQDQPIDTAPVPVAPPPKHARRRSVVGDLVMAFERNALFNATSTSIAEEADNAYTNAVNNITISGGGSKGRGGSSTGSSRGDPSTAEAQLSSPSPSLSQSIHEVTAQLTVFGPQSHTHNSSDLISSSSDQHSSGRVIERTARWRFDVCERTWMVLRIRIDNEVFDFMIIAGVV